MKCVRSIIFLSVVIFNVLCSDEVESSASGSPIIDVERVSSDEESYYQQTRSKSQSISESSYTIFM